MTLSLLLLLLADAVVHGVVVVLLHHSASNEIFSKLTHVYIDLSRALSSGL